MTSEHQKEITLFKSELEKTVFTFLSGCLQFDHPLMEDRPRPCVSSPRKQTT